MSIRTQPGHMPGWVLLLIAVIRMIVTDRPAGSLQPESGSA
ncbi:MULTISPECIES: hypothetical protein [unclassified Oceanobacter]|nr:MULTISPECIES: hypothetical protein [unclassified Oceanobacter]MDP2504445.1 hypothetical protein [Oceanobacter sp. 3_MG-2023]MDP2608644.1 hypothetical protein [Oceanobacter sp. 1_MG-2023]MDP2611740.1 hypothetical protein [Oceanobacter sp. 2_MG-2023]